MLFFWPRTYRFEIVVTLTGNSSLTGQMIQARSSYLPREIMWGNRFVNMIYYEKTQEVYRSDFDKFDVLEVVSEIFLCFLQFISFAR